LLIFVVVYKKMVWVLIPARTHNEALYVYWSVLHTMKRYVFTGLYYTQWSAMFLLVCITHNEALYFYWSVLHTMKRYIFTGLYYTQWSAICLLVCISHN